MPVPLFVCLVGWLVVVVVVVVFNAMCVCSLLISGQQQKKSKINYLVCGFGMD